MEIVRVRSTGFFFFALPLLFFGLVGVIFANGHPFERRHVAVVVSGVGAAAAQPLLDAMARYPEIEVSRERDGAAALGKLRAHVVNGVLARAPDGGLWRLSVGTRDELFGRGLAAILPGVELRAVALPRWGFVHYVFPGILVFNLVLSGLFGMGYHMVRYRQNLFLRKLATTPLSKSTFVAAQILGRLIQVLIQGVLLLAFAHFAFALPLPARAAALALLLMALGLLVFLGIGFALACVIHTEALIYDAISAVAWPIVLLSEFFFPADALPAPLPAVAAALPSTQMVRLLRDALLYGQTSRSALLPGLSIILVWTAVTFLVGRLLFRWT
jgi:ABC-type polysaccharide/polyol phosphate export permease